MKIIGITGGIASGKSTVLDYLESLGAQVICADDITHKLYESGQKGSFAISEEFGTEYLDCEGNVDRKKLGNLVFSDTEKLKRLNELIHPLVLQEIDNSVDKTKKIVFVDAALLIESGIYKHVDKIWLIVTDEKTRIERIVKRDGLTSKQAQKRIDSQLSDEEKSYYAHEIIDNNCSVDKTYTRIYELYRNELKK